MNDFCGFASNCFRLHAEIVAAAEIRRPCRARACSRSCRCRACSCRHGPTSWSSSRGLTATIACWKPPLPLNRWPACISGVPLGCASRCSADGREGAVGVMLIEVLVGERRVRQHRLMPRRRQRQIAEQAADTVAARIIGEAGDELLIIFRRAFRQHVVIGLVHRAARACWTPSAPPGHGPARGRTATAVSPKKVKSLVADELSHGVCMPSVAWFTSRRMRLNSCSIGRFCSRARCRKAWV